MRPKFLLPFVEKLLALTFVFMVINIKLKNYYLQSKYHAKVVFMLFFICSAMIINTINFSCDKQFHCNKRRS